MIPFYIKLLVISSIHKRINLNYNLIMKKFILFILLTFLSLPCFAEEVIYINKKWDKEASKILYEYRLSELNFTPEKAYEAFGYKLSDVRAIFYDLNSDGINEVIGYINVPSEVCVEGTALTILKKEKENFLLLANFNFYPDSGINILDSKTDGYFDIKTFFTKIQYNEKPKLHITRLYNSYGLAKYNKKLKRYQSVSN